MFAPSNFGAWDAKQSQITVMWHHFKRGALLQFVLLTYAATLTGVLPSSERCLLMSAPRSAKCRTTSTWPWKDAARATSHNIACTAMHISRQCGNTTVAYTRAPRVQQAWARHGVPTTRKLAQGRNAHP